MRNDRGRQVLVVVLLLPLLAAFDPLRKSNEDVDQGNAKLSARKYKEALKHYDAAAKELPDEAGVQYNRGIALFRLGRYKDAAVALSRATRTVDRKLKSKSFYNTGNAAMEQKRYEDAVEAYKGALRADPAHRSAKWNLELALRLLEQKKKQQKKKQQNKDQQNKDQKKDQQNKDQQNKDQQNKDQQNKDQQNKDQQNKDQQKQSQDDKQNQQQKQKQQPKPSPDQQRPRPSPSKRQMDSVLDALDRSDKNLQRQRARMMGRGFHRPTKDW